MAQGDLDAVSSSREHRADRPPERFSRHYRAWLRRVSRVTEPTPVASPAISEKLLRCLWFEQYFDTTALRTEDGRRLRLYSPGYWSDRPGPDFLNAEFALDDGPRQRGDVELHVAASGWNAHKHADDAAYGRVKLHVVLENDLGTPTVRHGRREVPQLVLRFHLGADLQDVIASLNQEAETDRNARQEGPCRRALLDAVPEAGSLGRFLDAAGDERMLRKAEMFRRAMARTPADEVLYAALMDCMGYSANRDAFARLCRAAPLAELRRRVAPSLPLAERFAEVEALLFGAAGLLDVEPDRADDGETRRRLRELRSRWNRAHRGLDAAGATLSRDVWVLRGTRPANHPARRIAAMAAFLARHLCDGLHRCVASAVERLGAGAGRRLSGSKVLAAVQALFDTPDGYWRFRAHPGPRTFARPMRLVGPARAEAIAVNAFIPFLLAVSRGRERAKAEAALHRVFCALPPAGGNAVTRYMKARLFGDVHAARRVVRSEHRQQGLIQLFRDFCGTDGTTCESCGFLAALEGRTA